MELSDLQKAIIKVANNYLGLKEIPQNQGFQDKQFEAKMVQIGWRKGWAWCAMFAKLVWNEAYFSLYGEEKAKYAIKNFSPNSQKTFRNFQGNDFKSYPKPKEGAIVIWKHEGSKGHTGIVVNVDSLTWNFTSIEGNSGDKVNKKFHKIGETNIMGFIYPIEL